MVDTIESVNPETTFELELQMRLLLDAVMLYRANGRSKTADLTGKEQTWVKSWRIRDSEVWMGNVGYYDVVDEALWSALSRTGDHLLEVLGGDQAEYDKAIERLCERGPGGHYARFCFVERM
jgi:hypothetical protein